MTSLLKPAVIWDLDGTLANNSHRLHYILAEKPDWAAYEKNAHLDTPIPHAVVVFNSLVAQDIPQIICTARHESGRQNTIAWLRAHNLYLYELMLMRPDSVHIPAVDFKRESIGTIREHGYAPFMAFEDQPNVVAMYRASGVPCYAADDRNWMHGPYRDVVREPA